MIDCAQRDLFRRGHGLEPIRCKTSVVACWRLDKMPPMAVFFSGVPKEILTVGKSNPSLCVSARPFDNQISRAGVDLLTALTCSFYS